MEWNVTEYADAMDEFLLKMKHVPSPKHPGMREAVARLARLLRIVKMQVTLYENIEHEKSGQGNLSVFYQMGETDQTRVCVKREIIENGNVMVYKAFQGMGDAPWTEVEREKIDLLLYMLFVFNGRSRAMQMLSYLTFHDREFGTYNIAYFLKTAGIYIRNQCIGNFTACYFNFRRLSLINQLIGRKCGTAAMQKFIKGLEDLFVHDEFIARIGGDNFLALFRTEKLQQVKDYLTEQNIVYNDQTGERITVSAAAGFYTIPEDITQPTQIMDYVSIAMNIAKNVQHVQFLSYDDSLMMQLKNKEVVEAMFLDAIAREEFVVYYQPKVRLREYVLAGAEALCRWNHNGEMIPPDRFIPILEQSNAICKLDFYMLEHVCRDIRQWLDEGREVVKISVNLSRRHMGDSDLLGNILSIIDKYKVPHQYIEIELTETTTDVAFNDLKSIVFGLQKQGISTSVDDFGVGYSSLNLIKELPWNVIKIDKSFLEYHEGNRGNYIMLKQVIAMAQELGMEVIVEGVETVEHIRMLKENNCYLAQGFYFDRPLPKEIFVERIGMQGHGK
ncbi:MAG: bifunctional diguanylate cyclase/phosphodiesterase [Lachnospiraceae bacterium]|nr:bifunctional diguanylate cyclase/phosphodiesterase [Lachnospiraceae bacterium]